MGLGLQVTLEEGRVRLAKALVPHCCQNGRVSLSLPGFVTSFSCGTQFPSAEGGPEHILSAVDLEMLFPSSGS